MNLLDFNLDLNSLTFTPSLYNDALQFASIIPVVCYNNAKFHQKMIIKENRGKAGIYR